MVSFPNDPRRASAGYMTNWAARLFARAIDRRLAPHGLSSGHMPVFFALAGGTTMTQKELALSAAIEQPTMAATLTRMERDGLIAREPDPDDRRKSLIRLTPAAEAKAATVMAAAAEVNALALSGLQPAERARFLADLERVVAALDDRPRAG
ncbi:MarR family winged helix-turn-helix transcriptional regulator [Aquibium sp. A9E412]|uniref:MarR family winged helix-turn-helix transcriptional regulator n=1 Tax=Aquibium sp. A9E412 TaxID=2976767 RepID=UPI0025B12B29|nr:MarR family winged helix-turn-helix transcriptional regulator [Aquibium sp. A9E412]MDN2566639.1 MarR family winged helix-turn-helix transcriptional regulator [Aquibium sp. A9E412]